MKAAALFAFSSFITVVAAQAPTPTTVWEAPVEAPTTTTPAELQERDQALNTSSITTHTVSVGSGGNFMMNPNVTYADVGDIIEFLFYPTGHWVIQGDEVQACVPYELIHPGKIGFSSGPMNVTDINDLPSYSVRINDTVPIFYYCGATDSCTVEHMVGAINPNKSTDFTFEHYYESSKSVSYQLVPGQTWPSEGGSSSATSSPKSTHTAVAHSSSALSGGAIAGISVGAVAVLVFGSILVYFCGRRGGVEWAQKLPWPRNYVPQSPGTSRSPANTGHDSIEPKPFSPMASQSTTSPPMSPGMPNTRSIVTSDASHYSGVFNMQNSGPWSSNTPPAQMQHPSQVPQQYLQMNAPVSMPMGMHPQMPVYPSGFVPPNFPNPMVAPHQQLYPQPSMSMMQSAFAGGAPSPPLTQPPNPMAELPASPMASQMAAADRSASQGQSELPSPVPATSSPLQQRQQQSANINTQIMESPIITSPLPRYSTTANAAAGPQARRASGNSRTFSFTQGEESSYRPAEN